MERRRLGNTGLRVSELGLGTMTWSRETDASDARDQLTSFVDAGGCLLDTAAGYADGGAEELIGSLLQGTVNRDEVVLATKAGISRRAGRRITSTARGFLLRELDASLQRLGVDSVDLWQVHTWDDNAPLEETLGALEYAVTSGRAAYVGISNYNGWQTARAATWQAARNSPALIASTQVEYSLLNRQMEYEVVPAAANLGLGVLPWSPLGRGVLTGKYRTGTPTDSRGASAGWSGFIEKYQGPVSRGIVEAVAKAAEGLGWTTTEVALAWVRDAPGVTAPIVGARTAAQLRTSLTTVGKQLPQEIRVALGDISTPSRGAPWHE